MYLDKFRQLSFIKLKKVSRAKVKTIAKYDTSKNVCHANRTLCAKCNHKKVTPMQN